MKGIKDLLRYYRGVYVDLTGATIIATNKNYIIDLQLLNGTIVHVVALDHQFRIFPDDANIKATIPLRQGSR